MDIDVPEDLAPRLCGPFMAASIEEEALKQINVSPPKGRARRIVGRPALAFRVDAGEAIGFGHVMRCFALAQAWVDAGGSATFIMSNPPSQIRTLLEGEGMAVVALAGDAGTPRDSSETTSATRSGEVTQIVVDGYTFGPEYQQVFKDAGLALILIDDDGQAGRYVADLIVNQNLHAEESMYENRPAGTRLLLGASFIMLRREFRALTPNVRSAPKRATKLLVTLGGTDRGNHTTKIIEALDHAAGIPWDVRVVVGPTNPHAKTVIAAAKAATVPVSVVQNPPKITELMSWADMAVCSGGSTVWELACLGVPAMVGITVPVEELLVGGLLRWGLFRSAGWLSDQTPGSLADQISELANDASGRARASRMGMKLVDGRGCDRVLDAIEALAA